MRYSSSRWFAITVLFGAQLSACGNEDDRLGPPPEGPIAANAHEAWPSAPSGLSAITPEALVRTCIKAVSCTDAGSGPASVGLCAAFLESDAERAIPTSFMKDINERVEFFTSCVENAVGCDQVAACGTTNEIGYYCEEDGCKAGCSDSTCQHPATSNVTCNGQIATVTNEKGTFTRDCARAFADCDATSPTGCTDRRFTACPSGGNRTDHCDGNVRLGCDFAGQVSYHDCTRLGGTCGTTADGRQDCIYDTDPECTGTDLVFDCDGTDLVICAAKKKVRVQAPTVCQPAVP